MADLMKYTKTALFFTTGAVATEDEVKAAKALQEAVDANVRIRNGGVAETGFPERCDYCAGNAPAAYRELYPFVDENGVTHKPEKVGEGFIGGTSEAPATSPESGTAQTSLESEVGSVANNGGNWGG